MDEGRIRKIIRIDMDAFYASVEQRDEPTLKGKPVAVGYPAKRGVVAAASYEARGFGVRSAMPSIVAIRKCAELVFVPPRFDVYREVSKQIHAIFKDHTRRNAWQRMPSRNRKGGHDHQQLPGVGADIDFGGRSSGITSLPPSSALTVRGS